jgi:DNA-binding Xre family transcriptional regulator
VNRIVTFTSPSGDEMVVVPAEDYRSLVDAAEMTADVAAFDEMKRKIASGEEEFLSSEVVDRLLGGENRILVWREYRGLSAKMLAEAAGITQAYLSQLETGKRDGTVGTMKKIAAALKVDLDDIV